jgi:Rrf2 family protein
MKGETMSYSLAFTQSVFVVLYISDKTITIKKKYISTSEISKVLNIPRPSAVKILTFLNRAGIVETTEGYQGGIRLAKNPDEITLLDLLNALEMNKPLFKLDHSINVSGPRPEKASANIIGSLQSVEDAMRSELEKITIRQLMAENEEN